MAPKTSATILAFDFGTHRIGVAVGNTLIRFAQPLVTIAGDSDTTTLAARFRGHVTTLFVQGFLVAYPEPFSRLVSV